ncbi:MAG: hypothetical protein R3325_01160 [Thermoanaerobaculia bacterium]|nr:hypothetical protein [Thermoanaerobaculia bacterium]
MRAGVVRGSRVARRSGPGLVALLALLLLAAPPGTRGQEPEPVDDSREGRVESVEEILAQEEAMLSGEGYFYDPGDRRDPFRSLLAARTQARPSGPRPEGVPGLLIDDIDLTGVFVTPEGPVAQVRAADKSESYLLREGDQLFDGDVVSIELDEIVFRQIVDDPTALKPFQTVRKQLNR